MKTQSIFAIGTFWVFLALGAPAVDPAPGWQHDCSSIKDWYDNKSDASFMAKIEQAEPSVIKVTQEGPDTWGKTAFLVKGIDLESTPLLQVKVTKVEKDSAYKLAVASTDWGDFHVVVPRSSADGVQIGDIKAATGWTGKKDFNIILIIEGKGKASYFDELKIIGRNSGQVTKQDVRPGISSEL
jgi:hypothetical protein